MEDTLFRDVELLATASLVELDTAEDIKHHAVPPDGAHRTIAMIHIATSDVISRVSAAITDAGERDKELMRMVTGAVVVGRHTPLPRARRAVAEMITPLFDHPALQDVPASEIAVLLSASPARPAARVAAHAAGVHQELLNRNGPPDAGSPMTRELVMAMRESAGEMAAIFSGLGHDALETTLLRDIIRTAAGAGHATEWETAADDAVGCLAGAILPGLLDAASSPETPAA